MLTNKQIKVLNTIKDFFIEYDRSPSLTDLQDALNISTKRGVVQYLESLEKKGYIQRLGTRGIQLVKKFESSAQNNDFMDISILGYANCGQPLAYAEEQQIGSIQVERRLLSVKNDLFVLIAKGDSMNEKEIQGKRINDKDFVIVAKNQPIHDGDAVVAVINDAATIKSFRKSDNMIVLYPESSNPVHQPIFLSEQNNSIIVGKVISVLNNPK